MTNLVATFTLSSGASAKVGEVAQESGTTLNNFTNPVAYTVMAEDDTATKDWAVTVTVDPAEFAGGDGTKENPYLVETANQLNNVRNRLPTRSDRRGDEHQEEEDRRYPRESQLARYALSNSTRSRPPDARTGESEGESAVA